MTASAPNAVASSNRSGTPSIAMTLAAPRALATATAYRPNAPAPWTTTFSPSCWSTRSSPYITCDRAQLAPAAISSDTASGTV